MKKNILKYVGIAFILVALIFGLTGCGESENTTGKDSENQTKEEDLSSLPAYNDESPEGFKEYVSSSGLKFSYPDTWQEVSTNSTPKPEITVADSETNTSANLLSDKIPTGYNLDTYVEASVKNLKTQSVSSSDIKNEKINLNGNKAYRLEYTSSQTVSGQKIDLKVIQVITEIDGKAFILTVGGLSSTENIDQVASQIANSVKK